MATSQNAMTNEARWPVNLPALHAAPGSGRSSSGPNRGRRAGARGHRLSVRCSQMAGQACFAELAAENTRLRHELAETKRSHDRFLAIAAHELRTPVTSVRGFAQLALKYLRGGQSSEHGRVVHALETIERQSRQLAALVSQLVDVNRIDTDQFTLSRVETDLAALCAQVVDELRKATPSRTITMRGSAELKAEVDPVRIEQLLSILLDNAAKFSPEYGVIEVEITAPDSSTVCLIVRDRGIGIPIEHRQSVFTRFFQVHRRGGTSGMGLGLYLAERIVALHGGSIKADEMPAGGTAIVVTLPRR